MVHGPLGRDPPPKSSLVPPTARRAPKAKAPPGAGTGLGSFVYELPPLNPPPAPASPPPVVSVPPPGPPARVSSPLPVGQVPDPLESKLQALDLLSTYLDAPLVEALRAKLSPPVPAPVTPTIASHRVLAQELADKCKKQEKLQTQLDQQRVKVAEVERTLERMQEELVDLVGQASDLDEEILELRRKVSIVPEPEEMEESSGSTPRALPRKRAKTKILRTKKVKILADPSSKIFKLAQGLSHGDLLKLAKRMEMALDQSSGSGATSSKNEGPPDLPDVEFEDDGYTSMTGSMTCG